LIKSQVTITQGIESLFGTRDENIRLLEDALGVTTHLLEDSLEIEGEPEKVRRAQLILSDYENLLQEGHRFTNGDDKRFL
jgi:phosphate starvation-inducible PhoH-like protein